jgi:hypothetical protein
VRARSLWLAVRGACPGCREPGRRRGEEAVEFTSGVNISFWIGIDLSSQTGYDGEAFASYLLPKGGWLCGTGFYPGNSNQGLVYAGKYIHSPKAKRH